MTEETIFSKIIRKEIPADAVYRGPADGVPRYQSAGVGDGFRLMIDGKAHGGQEVYHIHLRLLGGRPVGSMLTRPA